MCIIYWTYVEQFIQVNFNHLLEFTPLQITNTCRHDELLLTKHARRKKRKEKKKVQIFVSVLQSCLCPPDVPVQTEMQRAHATPLSSADPFPKLQQPPSMPPSRIHAHPLHLQPPYPPIRPLPPLPAYTHQHLHPQWRKVITSPL